MAVVVDALHLDVRDGPTRRGGDGLRAAPARGVPGGLRQRRCAVGTGGTPHDRADDIVKYAGVSAHDFDFFY